MLLADFFGICRKRITGVFSCDYNKLILTIKVIKLLSEGVCISCPCRLTLATDVFPSHCLLVHLSESIIRSFRNGFHCFEKRFWEE